MLTNNNMWNIRELAVIVRVDDNRGCQCVVYVCFNGEIGIRDTFASSRRRDTGLQDACKLCCLAQGAPAGGFARRLASPRSTKKRARHTPNLPAKDSPY